MESYVPLVNILVAANDRKVNEAPCELLDSRFVPISVNKTSLEWQYFAMVKDGLIMRNKIQYIYCCLLCLKKRPCKFLDSLVAIYNYIISNAHKHITSTHLNLHLARKR